MNRSLFLAIAGCLITSGCALFYGSGETPKSAAEDPESAAARERISSGFQALGMNSTRSECYALKIDSRLDGERLALAGDIVMASKDRHEVRSAVTKAGSDMTNAFFYANLNC